MLTYAPRFTSARLLCWWRATYPDRRWWLGAVLAIGYVIRVLRGDRVSPALAVECERVRAVLVEDMNGGGE